MRQQRSIAFMTKNEAGRRAVRVWLAEHGKTQVWLANELGIHESLLSRALAGYEKSGRVVELIKGLTGIDIGAALESDAKAS